MNATVYLLGYQEIPIDHDKCKVYRIQDGALDCPVYIYVGAITNAVQS